MLRTEALEGKYQGTTEEHGVFWDVLLMCAFPVSAVPVHLGICQWRKLWSEGYAMPFVLSVVSLGGAMSRDIVQAVLRGKCF